MRSPPLRILVISHTYVTPENRRKLEAMGRLARVRALVPEAGTDVAGHQAVRAEQARGYELRPLPIWGRTLPGTRWVFRRWADAWAGFDPDVVLLEQEVWSLVVLQALLLRRRHWPRAVLALFAWESVRRPGWMGARARLTVPFYRLATRRAAVLIAGNRDARDLFLRYGAAPSRVFVLPQLGLDPDRLHPVLEPRRRVLRQKLGVPDGVFLVGFAGRLVPEKGILDLLEAVERLVASGLPIRLAVAGSGPLLGELAVRQARGAPLLVRLPLPRHEMSSFYQALDAFVLPSRTTAFWKEQFGMAAAEAMACGLPVVGSSSGAIPDVLGRAGLVFTEGAVPELEAALARIAADAQLRAQLGAAARRRSARLFSHEAVAAGTLRALEIGLGEHREPPVAYCDLND